MTEIDVNDTLKDFTADVKIVGVKRATFRIKLGLLFIRFGVWITGMGFQVEIEE